MTDLVADTASVWKNSLKAKVVDDPDSPENCFTSWEYNKKYRKGATMCDLVMFKCLLP